MPTVTNIAAYRFAPLGELGAWREQLIRQCKAWNLRGTILLSTEGINLFVAGSQPEIDFLLAELRAIPGLEDLAPKVSESDEQPFTRMLVKIKKEIIAFGVEGIDPARNPAPRLSPRELKQWLDEGRAVTLLDTRNDFEVKLGTFRNAMPIGIEHFREFPKGVDRLPESLKTQPVVTFCTGGIRCEKAGPYLQSRGFEQVYQLDGGILKYFEECGDAHYEGECFVFDKRVGLEADLGESPRTLCFVCQTPLSGEEQLDPRFVESISCPHCFRSDAERRVLELARHQAAIARVTCPFPGSVPYENLRPFKVPGVLAGSTLLHSLQTILGETGIDWEGECDRGNLLDSGHRPASAERIVKDGERCYHRRPGTVEPDVNPNIRIIHEDEAIIVVNKPAPLPVHPSGRFNRNTLQAILREVYVPQKPRPAHRLDATTTGIVVFTRTAAFARILQPQFERGEVEIIYIARIYGHPSTDEFVSSAPVDSHPARTDFRVLRRSSDGTALVEARPRIDRTNQIRVHLGNLGWPIVDEPQTCLHASGLSFTHPLTGQRVTFEADPPEWASEILPN